MRNYAAALMNHDADVEDVAAEGLLRTLSRFTVLDPPDSLRAYLRVVIRNLVVDTVRLREREREIVERFSGDLRPWEDPLPTFEERRKVVQALRQMPPRERYVLIRVLIEGRSITEVADEIALTPNATSQLSFRARRRFRRLFQQLTVLRTSLMRRLASA
jgi:RNA polymerase sigma factor (sigma-70 family)